MTQALEAAIRRAQKLAPSFGDNVAEALRSDNFRTPLLYVNSEDRLAMLKAIWRATPRALKAELLAHGISNGDAPCRELTFIVRAMREVRAAGALVVSGPEGQAFFDSLPAHVTAYRGTTLAEVEDAPFFGVSWTIDRSKAEWFAMKHGRFRRLDSPPVLLTQTAEKADIAGAENGRSEQELFIDSSVTCRARLAGYLSVQRLTEDCSAVG